MATGRGTGDLSMVAKDIIAALNKENLQTNENTKAMKENSKEIEKNVASKEKNVKAIKTSTDFTKNYKLEVKALGKEIEILKKYWLEY